MFLSFKRCSIHGTIFLSCEPGEDPIIDQEADLVFLMAATAPSCEQLPAYGTSALINSYTVTFLGRTVAAGSTTFKYRVSGNGATPQLDSFFLELPDCAPYESHLPSKFSNLLAGAVKWNSSVSKDGSQDYSLTYEGDVPLGFIDATVTRGSQVETKKILGPCKGAKTLSGKVYIESNNTSGKQSSESGISGFKIKLYLESGSDPISSFCTESNGSYTFLVPEGGSYTIKADPLLETYTGIGDLAINIPNDFGDKLDQNFGFTLNTSKIVDGFIGGSLTVDTEPTRYWVDQLRNTGRKNGPSQGDMDALLKVVEGMYLQDPFYFGLGSLSDRRAIALDYLKRPIRTEQDAFLQQLLTAELNVASGRGVNSYISSEENRAFNQSLLNYAEGVACGDCLSENTSALSLQSKTTSKLRSSDTEMLSLFNGSGGIGK